MNAILPQTIRNSLAPTIISVYDPLLQGLPQQPQEPQGHFRSKLIQIFQGLPHPAMNSSFENEAQISLTIKAVVAVAVVASPVEGGMKRNVCWRQ